MLELTNGLYFEKQDDGAVRILKKADSNESSPVIFDHVLDAGQWASVVAAMSGTLAEGAQIYLPPIVD